MVGKRTDYFREYRRKKRGFPSERTKKMLKEAELRGAESFAEAVKKELEEQSERTYRFEDDVLVRTINLSDYNYFTNVIDQELNRMRGKQ